MIREGNRINFERNEENLADFFFNFSVTAHSIRDWCIKFQNFQSNKKSCNDIWDSVPCLKAAKDISNSLKHFGITFYNPTVKDSLSAQSKGVAFYLDENIGNEFEKAIKEVEYRKEFEQIRPSYIIKFEDGTTLNLDDYVRETISYWVDYFDKNFIPRNQDLNLSNVYLCQSYWHFLQKD